VSALSNNTMLGSDALYASSGLSSFNCPGQSVSTTGGGSTLGERALLTSSSQTVAPMSRFLQNATCSAADPAKAEGIAHAADGLSVLLSRVHQYSCDHGPGPLEPLPHELCDIPDPKGLRASGSVGTYVLGLNSAVTQVKGWQDVLRLIYLGLPNSAGKDPDGSSAAGRALRDCNSPVRQTLVNNWSNLFENSCSGDLTSAEHI